MSWAPADLVTDSDLLAYSPTIYTTFGTYDWSDLRAKVIEDWLWPALRQQGFTPERFRTRYTPTAIAHYASPTYTDYLAAGTSTTADDLPLATIFAASTNYLYIGSDQPFRGLSIRILDTPSSTAATLTVALWTDIWQTVVVQDGTLTSGVPFSRGGAITWTVPATMQQRLLNSVTGYWARLAMSAVPTGAKAGQIGVIRRSLLCGPATLRTLALILREAPLSSEGPWIEKATWYESQADAALSRVLPLLGGEFDTETEDELIDATEAAQTADEARGATAWLLERA